MASFTRVSVCLLAVVGVIATGMPTETSCFVSTSKHHPTHSGIDGRTPSSSTQVFAKLGFISGSEENNNAYNALETAEKSSSEVSADMTYQQRVGQMKYSVASLAASILLASNIMFGDINSSTLFSAPLALAADAVKTAAAPTPTSTPAAAKPVSELSPIEARLQVPELKAKIRNLKKQKIDVNAQARTDDRALSRAELGVKKAKQEVQSALDYETKIKTQGTPTTITTTSATGTKTRTKKPIKSPAKQKEDEEFAKKRVETAKNGLKDAEKRLADAKSKAAASKKAVDTNRTDITKSEDRLKKTKQRTGGDEALYAFEKVAPWVFGAGLIQWYRTKSRNDDMRYGDDGGFRFDRLLPGEQYNDRDEYGPNGRDPYFRPARTGRGGSLARRSNDAYNDGLYRADGYSSMAGGRPGGVSGPRVRLSDLGKDEYIRNNGPSEYDGPYRREDLEPGRPGAGMRLSDIGKGDYRRNSEYDDPYRRDDPSAGPGRPRVRLSDISKDEYRRNVEYDDPYHRQDPTGPSGPRGPYTDNGYWRNDEYDDPYRRVDPSGPRRPPSPYNDPRMEEYRRENEYDDPYRREDPRDSGRPPEQYGDARVDEYGDYEFDAPYLNEPRRGGRRDDDRSIDLDYNGDLDRYDDGREYNAQPPRRPRQQPKKSGQARSDDRWNSSVSPWD